MRIYSCHKYFHQDKIMLHSFTPKILTLIVLNIVLTFAILFVQCTKHVKAENHLGTTSLVPKAIINASEEIILKERNASASSIPLKIVKSGGTFFIRRGERNENVYYVKEDVIERFFKMLTQEVSFTFITNNFYDYASYSISEETAFSIRFVGEKKEVLLDIYFGCLDATGERQYARRGNVASSVLSIEDIASSFLTTEPSFWVDMQIYKEKLKNNHITSIEVGNEAVRRSLADDALFFQVEQVLKSLTMINIYDGTLNESNKSKHISITFEKGDNIEISITPLETTDFIFWDNRGGTYILSSYSHKRLMEKINLLL